jgi:DNA-binding NtrC family response regulator
MSLRILVVDDEKVNRTIITQRLNDSGHLAEAHETPFTALTALEASNWDVVLTDLCMPSMDGIQFLKEIKSRSPETSVILMTAFGNIKTAVEAMRAGAVDYMSKPFGFDELSIRLERLAENRQIRREIASLRKSMSGAINYCGLVGASPQMRRVFELIERFADNPSNILIVGETGTGKEQVARALHAQSTKSKGPFVALGCANIPRELAESELFGHEAGAFTGASKRRKGRVEMAQGGTLFLDDVDDMPLDLQGKLLRVLQERQFERVGGETTVRAEARVVSATKNNLESLVAQGKFRDDLMYRLKVLVITLAPLRERREDIILLAQHFLTMLMQERGGEPKTFSTPTLERLVAHAWPGNVRELRHAVEYSMAISPRAEIQPEDLPQNLKDAQPVAPFALHLDGQEKIDLRELTNKFEQDLIHWALQRSKGNQGKAAELLSIPRTTLQSKLRDDSPANAPVAPPTPASVSAQSPE